MRTAPDVRARRSESGVPLSASRPGAPSGRRDRQRRAVLILFFVNGASFASWLPRVPEVRERLDLSLGTLGLVLLGTGLGGLASSAVGGVLVDRVGSRRSAVVASVALGLGLPLIGLAPSALALGATLVALSAVDAVADISMNVQAADVDARTTGSVIQRFHAAWSVGSVAGAGAGTAAAALGIGLTWQLAVTGLVLGAATLAVSGGLSVVSHPRPEPSAPGRRGPVLVLLASLAAVVAVAEGAPGDWAAVFISDVHGAGRGVAGVGFVAVSGGMVVGRLVGDRVTDHLGGARTFRSALVLVACGLAVVVASPDEFVAIGGFAIAGLGISVLFPALYLQAATTPRVPPGLGVGVMSSGARVGFLVSPVVVGALSEAATLRVGLGVVVGTAIAGALVLAPRLGARAADT